MSKNTQKRRVFELVAIAAAVVGLVIYLITSTTGYLAGRAIDPLPIVLTVVGIAVVVADLVFGARLAAILRDALVVGGVALLSGALFVFLLSRVPLAADVYFIPVNYPEAEEVTLTISLVGMAVYLVAVLALIVEAFTARRSSGALSTAAA